MKSGSILLEYLLASGLGILIVLGLVRLLQCILAIYFQAYALSYLQDQGRWLSIYFNNVSHTYASSLHKPEVTYFETLSSQQAKKTWGIQSLKNTSVLVIHTDVMGEYAHKTAYYIASTYNKVNNIRIHALYRKLWRHRAQQLLNNILSWRINILYCSKISPSHKLIQCGVKLNFLLRGYMYNLGGNRHITEKHTKQQLLQWWPVILYSKI